MSHKSFFLVLRALTVFGKRKREKRIHLKNAYRKYGELFTSVQIIYLLPQYAHKVESRKKLL